MTLDSKDREDCEGLFFFLNLFRYIIIISLTFNEVSLFTKNLLKFLSLPSYLRSCRMMTEDSPTYTLWSPFLGGASSKFSNPRMGSWTLCAYGGLSLLSSRSSHSSKIFMEGFWLLFWRVWIWSKYGSWQLFGSLILTSPEEEGLAELVSKVQGSKL